MPIARRPDINVRGSPAFTSFHAILAFLGPVLVNFVEVKFQGKPEPPFETHPFATSLAIFCLLFYCALALVTRLSLASACYARLVDILMMLAAMLSVASLASLLVPGPFQSLPYLLSLVLLPVVLLPCLARNLYTWVHHNTVSIFFHVFRPRRLAASPLLPRTVMNVHASCWNWEPVQVDPSPHVLRGAHP